MRRISSSWTVCTKVVVPVACFLFLAFVEISTIKGDTAGDGPLLDIAPAVMFAAVFYFFRQTAWKLVDAIYDEGQFIRVKNRGEEESIALHEVVNINASSCPNRRRVTIRLRRDTKFGREIAFQPPMQFGLNPFAKNEMVEELIERMDKARVAHRS